MSNITASVLRLCCHFIFLCLPFQRVSFMLFYCRIFSLIIILTFTFPLFKSSIYLQSRAKYIGNLLGFTENLDLK